MNTRALLLPFLLLGCARERNGAVPPIAAVEFDAGDYDLPRLSPDGAFLAFSEIVRLPEGISTQLLLYNIEQRRLDTLLNAQQAWRFATYSASATSISWQSDTSFVAHIGDGDVDGTEVTVNVASGVVGTSTVESGMDVWPPKYQPLADTLAVLYPEVAPDSSVDAARVFGSGLEWPTIQGPGFVVMQKRYSRVEDDVWMYRTDRREATRLAALPPGPRASLSGGFAWRSGIVFAAGDETIHIFYAAEGKVDTLDTISARRQQHRVQALAMLSECAWFLVQTGVEGDSARNPLYVFDGSSLARFRPTELVDDATLDANARFIAYSRRHGARRSIRLESLGAPCTT